ncbi:MAG TPA: hypothetical protein PK340_02315 [Bacilli bacterium]|nr:hypothetical protein [Bacilli bacterium]
MKRVSKMLFGLTTLLAMSLSVGLSSTRAVETAAAGGTGLEGWELNLAEGATGSLSTSTGFIVADITNPGTAGLHVKLANYGETLNEGESYSLTIRAKASKTITADFIVNNAPGWNTMAENRSVSIGTSFQNITANFTAYANETDVEYLFEFGNNSSWGTNTGSYVLTIEKITLDVQEPSAMFSDDFSSGLGSNWYTRYSDNATGNLSVIDGALVQEITSYGAGHVWIIGPYVNTDVDITQGEKYIFRFNVSVTYAQNYEVTFEDYRLSHEYRAGFSSGSWTAGSHTYVHIFDASTSLTDVYVSFALGQSSGTTPNSITFDNMVLSSYTEASYETRPGYYVSEFGAQLELAETCVADPESGYGYMDVPTLKTTYYDKLLDIENLGLVSIQDYDYIYGQGSGEKVAAAVTVEAKWLMMVAMYNANNGELPDVTLAPVSPYNPEKFDLTIAWVSLLTFGLGTASFIVFHRKRKSI